MAIASSPFLSVAALDNAIQLHGDRAVNPWTGGDVIVAHGTFDDGTESGLGAFVVIRRVAPSVYILAPVGCADPDWQEHLQEKPQIKGRVLRCVKEKIPEEMDLIRRWRKVGSTRSPPSRTDLVFLGEEKADAALQQYKFLVDLVVSDNQAPQE